MHVAALRFISQAIVSIVIIKIELYELQSLKNKVQKVQTNNKVQKVRTSQLWLALHVDLGLLNVTSIPFIRTNSDWNKGKHLLASQSRHIFVQCE